MLPFGASLATKASQLFATPPVAWFFWNAPNVVGKSTDEAQRLLNALGTGTLVKDTGLSDTVDVVVVLGQDYIDSLGGGTTVTTLPAGGTVPTVSAPSGSVAPGATGGETTG